MTGLRWRLDIDDIDIFVAKATGGFLPLLRNGSGHVTR
jgi:hypothetical protein